MDSCNVVVFHDFYPHDDWIKVGTHFYNEHFIKKGCRVLNLVHAGSILSLLKPNVYKLKRMSSALRGNILVDQPGVGKYNVSGIITFFQQRNELQILNSEFFSKHYFMLSYPPIKSIVNSWGHADILFFNVFNAGVYYQIDAKLKIFRIQDHFQTHPLDSGFYKNIMEKIDIILTVSNPIYDMAVKQRGTSEGVYLLPNGCDIDKFLEKYPAPLEYENIPRPIALYVGGMGAGHFDWDLLINLAKRRPDVSFVLIGRANNIVDLPKNVYILGYRHHDELPAYMQHANIGLIPLCDNTQIRAVERPLKFYQYIASGLPVVTVSYGAMKAMAPQAILANTPEEFSNGIDQALGYTLGQRQSLQEFSKQFSWDNVFKRFDEIISLHYPEWLQ